MTLTKVDGIMVGHATDRENQTGCTAILCPEGASPGVDVRGFAPGTREVPLIDPCARVEEVHGILLTGGSAFGLAAATGIVKWLAERGYGVETPFARVPLVPSAVIYDLNFNRTLGKPDEAMGYEAASTASKDPVAQGNVGAGTGATCGKLAGFERAMKSGLGSASAVHGNLQVGTIAVVNPLGSVLDPDTNQVIAGVRTPDGKAMEKPEDISAAMAEFLGANPPKDTNTVIGVVATNAKLTKVQSNRVARMASAGLSIAIRPAHLLYDGDVVFCLATGKGPEGDENIIGAIGAELMARAVANGALHAQG